MDAGEGAGVGDRGQRCRCHKDTEGRADRRATLDLCAGACLACLACLVCLACLSNLACLSSLADLVSLDADGEDGEGDEDVEDDEEANEGNPEKTSGSWRKCLGCDDECQCGCDWRR